MIRFVAYLLLSFTFGIGGVYGQDIGEYPKSVSDTVTIMFTGDVMAHISQVNAAYEGDGVYDFSPSFEYVSKYFKESDLAVVNLETTLSDSNYSGYPMFRTPRSLANALADSGVDVAVLANNHCCDGGLKGIQTTISTLRNVGVEHTGVFDSTYDREQNNPLHVDIGDVTVAIYNYTYGTNGNPIPKSVYVNEIDTLAIKSDLKDIEGDSIDCVIFVMHWGYEYQLRESAQQRQLAQFLKGQGVDIVVGHHPHVVQPVDCHGDFMVIYSLGNFVSNQRKRHTDGGAMARISIVKDDKGRVSSSVEVIPTWVSLPGYKVITPLEADSVEIGEYSRVKYDQHVEDINRRVLSLP